MANTWKQTPARDLKVGDRIIRNVKEGFEWVPGPYGAFIIKSIKAYGDEFRFVAMEARGDPEAGALEVKFRYDGDELVPQG